MPDSYSFAGWYKDEACTQPFNFASEKMGPNSLMLYAKWDPPVVHATVYDSMEAGAGSVTHTLPYNESINPNIMPTVKDFGGNVVSAGDPATVITLPENHKWIGWSTKSGSTYTTFNFATKLLNDIELYPYYVSIQTYSVTYHPGVGTGSVEDDKTYFAGAYADVQPGTINPPARQVFLGWTLAGDPSGKIYVANDKIFIDGNKLLTAVFGPKLQSSLVYKANGGVGDDVIYELQNNASHTIIPNPSYTREGYQFIGWNTYANGSGLTYKPGQTVLIDGGENILYALWEELISVTAQKLWNFPAPGITRPDIWFTLYRTNADSTQIAVGTQAVPDAATGGAVTWNNLPKTDGNGYTYVYTVKETTDSGSDYTPPSFTKKEEDLTVTNTYEYIDFEVRKVWAGDDLPSEKPPIQVQLQVSTDGVNYVDKGNPVTLTSGMSQYKWYNLPKKDSQGFDLSYRAIESSVPASYIET